jgi:hypothetical protein
MAIGQLADYGRFRPDAQRVILLPERPSRQDLMDLVASQEIAVVWPSHDGYEGTPHLPW